MNRTSRAGPTMSVDRDSLEVAGGDVSDGFDPKRSFRTRQYLSSLVPLQQISPPDLPDGLIFRNRVKPPREKYFAFPETQIRRRVGPFCSTRRGARAIATNVGAGCDGRFRCARRRTAGRTAKPCGLGTPMLVSSRRMIPPVMVANKPGAPGRARSSR
jgi:hypothetical protein